MVLNASFWPPLATVIVAFLNSRNIRNILITTKENEIIKVKGISKKELILIWERTEYIAAIDTGKETKEILK
ncbi:MAG: hypothetical protein OCC49_19565 [Fibrobacterales bacterium]